MGSTDGSLDVPHGTSKATADRSTDRPRTDRRTWLALLVLVVLGFGLRWRGTDFCLPHRLVADERVFNNQLHLFRHPEELGQDDPRFGFYPHLVSRLAWLCAPEERPHDARTLAEHLAAASADPLLLRRIVATLSVLVIPATFLLARLFLRPALALGAAALVAGSLLHVWYSAQARPHTAASGFVVLGLVGAVLVRRRADPQSYLLAGAMIAIAVAILQTGFLLVPVLFFAHVLRRERRPGARIWLALALALVAASFLAFYPYVFGSKIGADVTSDADASVGNWLGSTELGPDTFTGRGFVTLFKSLWHFDPAILVLAVGTLSAFALHGWRRRRRSGLAAPARAATTRHDLCAGLRARLSGREDLAVVCAHALGYLVLFGAFAGTVQRYAIPLLPYAACVAVAGLDLVAERLAPRRRFALAAILVTTVALVQISAAAWLGRVRSAPDTSESAALWLSTHLDPERVRIAILPGLELPLLRDHESLTEAGRRAPTDARRADRLYPWFLYQRELQANARRTPVWRLANLPLVTTAHQELVRDDPRAYLRAVDADWIVIEVWDRPLLRELRAELAAHAILVARLTPKRVDDGDDRPFLWREQMSEYEEGPCWAWRALSMRALGTVVEVYRRGES